MAVYGVHTVYDTTVETSSLLKLLPPENAGRPCNGFRDVYHFGTTVHVQNLERVARRARVFSLGIAGWRSSEDLHIVPDAVHNVHAMFDARAAHARSLLLPC